jgi:hypothetical protein
MHAYAMLALIAAAALAPEDAAPPPQPAPQPATSERAPTPVSTGDIIADGFELEDTGAAIDIIEDARPVLTLHYHWVAPPEGVSDRYRRTGYIHPLHSPLGDILTQDYPDDHYHHRGVFWAWPYARHGDRLMDIWVMAGVRKRFDRFLQREADGRSAQLAWEACWAFDADPDTPILRETVRLVVYPRRGDARAIDFDLTFANVSAEAVILQGSLVDDKGYGGFCIRPDANRRPLTFTSAEGVADGDALLVDSPWADVSSATKNGRTSGVAIFQHPDNPGYPHAGWIFRHYGFLGASWPHVDAHVLQPGETVRLRYRVYTHAGDAEAAEVEAAWEAYRATAGDAR